MTTDNQNSGQPTEPKQKTNLSGEVSESHVPVVGIGASAGGLEAFRELFAHLAVDIGFAYVVIQHISPTSDSVLAEILQRETRLSVVPIDSVMAIEPNHVYVMQPASDIVIKEGKLQLIERQTGQAHLPIDTFFTALAEEMGASAIGIILSGTASDGVLGLKQIKAAGGMTFAQQPESARYPDMPRNAVAAHCVDFVLEPRKIAAELARIGMHGRSKPPLQPSGEKNASAQYDLSRVLYLLRRHTGHDFSYYKHSTLQRRLERQMGECKCNSLEEYIKFLEANPDAITRLFQDILINVTGFFRDPEMFDYLREEIFPKLLQRLPPKQPLRLWVPGCSSGEEPYSLAITLLETMEASGQQASIKIFATDVDEQAVNMAREGVYSRQIAERMQPEQLAKYFTEVKDGYQIGKTVRDLCVFSVQNVVTDPPFSRIDLISCRNLLIYLGQILQKRLIPVFHYALMPGGYLLLGMSETIGRHADLFAVVDNTYKVYRKTDVASPPLDLPGDATWHKRSPYPIGYGGAPSPLPEERLEKQADHLLLDKFAPPAVLIDQDMNIVQFRGHTGAYLEPAPGRASLNLLQMARDSLVPELRAAVIKAAADREVVQCHEVQFRSNMHLRKVNITVIPLGRNKQASGHLLILFEDVDTQSAVTPMAPGAEEVPLEEAPKEILRLREELTVTREYLHSVIEQQKIANEEARCANEEIQASNEELQSINEELETAKEELQSTNEELTTVNDELDTRNRELSRANDDLQNLVSSVNIPLIMVGNDLSIRLFSPLALKAFNLIPEDVGRPIMDLHQKIRIPELDQQLRNVIQHLSPYNQEVQDQEGHWYQLQIRPYKTEDQRIDGAVMVFLDITAARQALEETRRARDFAHAVITALKDPLLVLDEHLQVEQVSDNYLQLFQAERQAMVGKRLYRLGEGQWDDPRLRAALEQVIQQGQHFEGLQLAIQPGKSVLVSGRPIEPGKDVARHVLLQVEVIAS